MDIETNMPTCGTPWHQQVEISQLGRINTVGRNTHRIVIGSHSGTHMDAPYHFIEDGITMEALDINQMGGTVTVADFRSKGRGDIVTLDDVRSLDVKEKMIFVFGWYHYWKTEKYYKEFPYFETEAVKYLIENGMRVMALDTPSPDNGSGITDREGTDSPNHIALLSNKVIIIEYLCNTDVLIGGKEYEMIALPLKIKGSDGSPARVLIKEE